MTARKTKNQTEAPADVGDVATDARERDAYAAGFEAAREESAELLAQLLTDNTAAKCHIRVRAFLQRWAP